MTQDRKIVLALVIIFVIAAIIYFCTSKDKKKSEDFTWANTIQELPGTYNLQPNEYELLDNGSVNPHKFADIVAPASPPIEQYTPQYPQTKIKSDLPLPTRPFDTDYNPRMLLPDDTTSVTMYDRDVSDPAVYLFRASNRAQIKNRQHETADPLRGDLAITPCRKGWFDSRYSEGDSKLDGYFSAYTNSKYAMLTGQKSYPSNISNEGLIMDYTNSDQDPVMSYY
jgi:hypothetical protein